MAFSNDQLQRYAHHILLPEVGSAGQLRLRKSRVLVIGAGGLGSPLLLYLAAAGVGTIGLADHDNVALTNLQRQIIHDTFTIGELKTVSAMRRLNALNPEVEVKANPFAITEDNARSLIGGYDLVADASDNAATRYLVNDACFYTSTCLVSAAVAGFEGQLTTFRFHLKAPLGEPSLGEPSGDGYPCYRCLFPTPSTASRPCSDSGIMGATAGIVGAMQASEVIKELLGLGTSLAGFLLLYDGLNATAHKFKIRRNPTCELCGCD